MRGCLSGSLSRWALRQQGKYPPPCRCGGLYPLAEAKTHASYHWHSFCVLCHSLERKESFLDSLFILNTEAFMRNSKYMLFLWWRGKRLKGKVVITADVCHLCLWLYISSSWKGEGRWSQKQSFRNYGCHLLWPEGCSLASLSHRSFKVVMPLSCFTVAGRNQGKPDLSSTCSPSFLSKNWASPLGGIPVSKGHAASRA